MSTKATRPQSSSKNYLQSSMPSRINFLVMVHKCTFRNNWSAFKNRLCDKKVDLISCRFHGSRKKTCIFNCSLFQCILKYQMQHAELWLKGSFNMILIVAKQRFRAHINSLNSLIYPQNCVVNNMRPPPPPPSNNWPWLKWCKIWVRLSWSAKYSKFEVIIHVPYFSPQFVHPMWRRTLLG